MNRDHKIPSIKQYKAYTSFSECKKKSREKDIGLLIATFTGKFKMTREVKNLCNFSCCQCDFDSNNWRKMSAHINNEEHGPLLSPIKYLKSVTLHKCTLCKEMLLCDQCILTNHLKKHGHSLLSYKNNEKFISKESMLSKYKSMLKSETKNIPSVKPKDKCTLKPNSLPDNQTTKSVGNLSWYKCNYCSKTNLSYGCLRDHYKRRHKRSHCPHKKQLLLEARYHKCLICKSIVLCDNSVLQAHIGGVHKMNFFEYQTNYVLKNGGRVFPTFREYLNNRQVFDKFEKLGEDCSSRDDHKSDIILPSMLSSESEDSDEESK